MRKCLLILFAFVLFDSCKKSDPGYWYTGMQIIDTNYKLVRWVGQQDYDWQINKYTLNTQQLYAMVVDSFTDSAFWNHSGAGTVTVKPGTNPIAWDTGTVYYQFNSIITDCTCFLSYIVTDQYNVILLKKTYQVYAGSYLPLVVSIPSSKVQTGQVYRIYYSFSARGNPYFATGWGDFGICTQDAVTYKISNCF